MYLFDHQSSQFRIISGPDGQSFTASSALYSEFQRILVSGKVAGPQDVGYEVYELNDDFTVSLFQDIEPGAESSFFDLDKTVHSLETSDYLISLSGMPTVLFSDGTFEPFSEFFGGISTITSARFAGKYQSEALIIAEVDGNYNGQLIGIDRAQAQYRIYDQFEGAISSASVSNVFVLQDRLFANIGTSTYGKELWELVDGVWTIVEDLDPGFWSSSPSYEFTQNGAHYFTAVTQDVGRELFRLDADGLSLALDANPGSANGLVRAVFLRVGEDVYFQDDAETVWFRMDAAGVIHTSTGFGADGTLDTPSFVVNFDTQEATWTRNSYDASAVYVVNNGLLRPFDLPDGIGIEADGLFFLNGTLFLKADDGASGTMLYAYAASGEWVALFDAPYETGVPLPSIYDLSMINHGGPRDVWFGDDSDEVVLAPDVGGIIYAEAGNDSLMGGVSADALYAGDGDDTLTAGDGDDTLDADRGADHISGGDGDDQAWGDGGDDTIFGDAGNDTLRGGRQWDSIDGGAGDDSIVGQRHGDTLLGGLGSDTLKGGGGADLMVGGEGDDFLKGGSYADTLLGGAGDDRLVGNRHDDVLDGGAGRDKLNGGGNDDTLIGGAGDDWLVGGIGADFFVFEAGSGQDTIADLDLRYDKISLTGADLGGQSVVDLAAAAQTTEAGLLLTLTEGDTILLSGVTQSSGLEAVLLF
ncbi:calcium-binding protein [Tropicibacter naphthalenivorans]|nr:calcium-binding protein [Tropicibacter naphthalenivorans]